ncbi:hypothetical protein [Actinomycetospora atypica]|uniref:Uncharacterized protein n=1 Tax=Actinomycetospora atypica TaxID=1290095 RepID=A0ABV9YFN4_9PSEU
MSMLLGLRELLGEYDATALEPDVIPSPVPDDPVVEIEAVPRRPVD